MSTVQGETGFSGYEFPFQTVQEAGLVEVNSLFKSELEQQLEIAGIAAIDCPISLDDYAEVGRLLRECIDSCPTLLQRTFHAVDRRYGNEAGYVRKERKIDPATGKQTQDPKSLFHFNEQARIRWQDEFSLAPVALRRLLEAGAAVHNELLAMGKLAITQLEETHPRIGEVFFPAHASSVSFYRKNLYDSYEVVDDIESLPVAKKHRDISGFTIQGGASAPGFWAETNQGKQYFDTPEGVAYFFAGVGFAKLYGSDARIHPSRHGVDRVIPTGATYVESRESDVIFLDPWKIDPQITSKDTLGY